MSVVETLHFMRVCSLHILKQFCVEWCMWYAGHNYNPLDISSETFFSQIVFYMHFQEPELLRKLLYLLEMFQ